ncbi:MAG: MmgE/PrpD family protein [Deltaproteobacteria bacterium]|nr:MmgE/PrpD family protein [Deltaproteobacteria bacterium]
MSTTLERIAAWSTALRFEDIPDRVVEKAKLQLLSMIAAVYAGYPTRTARTIREVILSTRANGRSTVFPQGDRSSPTVAVVANAAASMALDFDDYLFLGHTGHSAVLASFAQAQESGLDGKSALLAQIIGNEVGGRLGASVVLGPQNGQLWTHLHAPVAACVGAKLLGLTAEQTSHAMALALYQPPFAMWPGFMGPDSKLLSAAFPARDGLLCASLASWGLTGPLDILDSEIGFGQHFAHHYLPGMFTGFGQAWVSDTLSFKIYPGCAYLDSILDALFENMKQFEAVHNRPFEPADLVKITVRTSLLSSEMNHLSTLSSGDPCTPVRINFSIPYSLAMGLLKGKLGPLELAEEELDQCRQELQAMSEKIEIVHDWSLTLEMVEKISDHLPLRALLGIIDFRKILAVRNEVGRQLGTTLIPSPKDLLRIGSFLWARAPGLVRQASRAAANGFGQLSLERKDKQAGEFDLAQADFENMPMPFGSEVTMQLRGNQKLTCKVDIPLGAAGRDQAETTGLVRKKFRDLASPLLTEQQVERALELVSDFENLPDLAELTECLCVN